MTNRVLMFGALALFTLALPLSLRAQGFPPPATNTPYEYRFVPDSGSPQWGGEIWVSVPSETNGITGINEEFSFNSYITTPWGRFSLEPEDSEYQRSLPQTPFPYTGTLYVANSQQNDFGAFPFITWNEATLTSLIVDMLGDELWYVDAPASPFQNTNIFGVWWNYNFEVNQDSIVMTNSFEPLAYSQYNDPYYNGAPIISPTGSATGHWVLIGGPIAPLAIASAGDHLVLSWPTNGINYVVQSAANVAHPNWTSLTNLIQTTISNSVTVNFTNSSPAAFFRLGPR